MVRTGQDGRRQPETKGTWCTQLSACLGKRLQLPLRQSSKTPHHVGATLRGSGQLSGAVVLGIGREWAGKESCNSAVSRPNLTHVSRVLPRNQECSFFSDTHGPFPSVECSLGRSKGRHPKCIPEPRASCVCWWRYLMLLGQQTVQ